MIQFSEAISAGLCIGIAFMYVGSLYVWEVLDPAIARLGRDHATVIQRRTISVVVSTILTVVLTSSFTDSSVGVPRTTLKNLVRTASQTCILMTGPILHAFLIGRAPHSFPNYWVGLRNLIIAPITEEIVFRECFLRILTSSGISSSLAALVSPALFALAHVHHTWGTMPVSASLMSVAHTFVFGWISFYFLIKRSVWDSILAHMVCNAIGLPVATTSYPRILLSAYAAGSALFLVSL
jgi:prenyl protein peptidase